MMRTCCGSIRAQFRGFVQPMLGFTTSKNVRLSDWRLGLILRLLQALAVLFTVVNMGFQKTFLKHQVPSLHLSMYVQNNSTQEALDRNIQDFQAGEQLESNLCAKAERGDYTYQYDDAWTYNVVGCLSKPKEFFAIKGPTMSSYFITTTESQQKSMRVPVVAGEDCQTTLDKLGAGCTINKGSARVFNRLAQPDFSVSKDGAGTCVCETEQSFVLDGVDTAVFSVDHIGSVLFEEEGFDFARTETVVRVRGNDVSHFQAGETIRFSVKKMLEWMQMDLDKSVIEEPNRRWFDAEVADGVIQGYDAAYLQGQYGTENGLWPLLRLTGVRVVVEMKYYNYNIEPGESQSGVRKRSPNTKVCVMELRPKIAWTSLGDDQTISLGSGQASTSGLYRYGIHLDFQVGGFISRFDWNLALQGFIDVLVLLNFSNLVVRMIAIYCMGNNSVLYKQMTTETISIPEAYARFVMQAIAASSIFDKIDDDASGELCLDELYTRLMEIFSGKLDTTAAVCLSDAVMKVAVSGFGKCTLESIDRRLKDHDKGGDVGVAREEGIKEKRSLTRSEFVNIFTGPPCTLEGCMLFTKNRMSRGWVQKVERGTSAAAQLLSSTSIARATVGVTDNPLSEVPEKDELASGFKAAQHIKRRASVDSGHDVPTVAALMIKLQEQSEQLTRQQHQMDEMHERICALDK
mmetsp:Transcript_1434/g.2971  ORF Transcript_1434/g.2971 Transcript_1434/m.2971 type:complete len:687 (+) Transcript_1434:241-2301(+)